MENDLRNIQNDNGGGLSFDVTGKYTSVRHALARLDGKSTFGEAAKLISKELKIKILAKELLEAYQLFFRREPEWHHAGFYKNSRGKSTMGRTFFMNENEVIDLIENWNVIDSLKLKKIQEIENLKKIEIEKSKFITKYAIPFNREKLIPKFAVIRYSEMLGRHGWFVVEAHHNYTLEEYYTGFAFKSLKTLEKFKNIENK